MTDKLGVAIIITTFACGVLLYLEWRSLYVAAVDLSLLWILCTRILAADLATVDDWGRALARPTLIHHRVGGYYLRLLLWPQLFIIDTFGNLDPLS